MWAAIAAYGSYQHERQDQRAVVHQLTQEIMSGMREWRAQHPKATLREMEGELDARWARVRARMLEDMALPSAAADWTETLQASSQPARSAVSSYNSVVPTLVRYNLRAARSSASIGSMAAVRPAELAFSPLDDELGLLPGSLSPWLQEALVRLSTHIPSFAKAARELTFFTGVEVPPDTARRHTERAGALLVAHETALCSRHPGAECGRRDGAAGGRPVDRRSYAGCW